jgi:hypothetical protein
MELSSAAAVGDHTGGRGQQRSISRRTQAAQIFHFFVPVCNQDGQLLDSFGHVKLEGEKREQAQCCPAACRPIRSDLIWSDLMMKMKTRGLPPGPLLQPPCV